MEKFSDRLYSWQVFNDEKKLNFNGLYLRPSEDWILVDPPSLSETEIIFIEKTGKPRKIYLTNKHHTRASSEHRKRWGSTLFIHKRDQPLMEIPVDGTFSDEEILEKELKVIGIPHSKTPGESAFFWSNTRTLIIGDAVIGKPAGALSLLPDEKFKDPKLARQGLTVLRELPVERLMVGDGIPILENAGTVLKQFLSQLSQRS
jgi:glyoxylase-like metal-dependent hydrolase (beta-lactamase superfamily II)